MPTKHHLAAILSAAAILGCGTASAQDEDFETPARRLVESAIQGFLSEPVVINAVRKQNERTITLSQDEIIALDDRWRADDASLITPVMQNPVSEYLRNLQNQHKGFYTELFVIDAVGLNVGQSDITSDYWQGDEAKYQQTFLIGENAVHISDVEEDESSQTFQVQISLPIVDQGELIGAATFGVDVEALLDFGEQ